MQPHATWPSYIFTIVVVAVIFGLRLWRSGLGRRPGVARRLRLEYLWITPALVVFAAGALLAQFPPEGLQWVPLAAVLALGAALGWWRGALTPIEIDRETHALNTRSSPAAIAFLGLLVLVRFGAHALLSSQASSLHIATALLTDGFVLFAAGLYGVSRLEMWLRASRLLREARASGAHGMLSEAQSPKPWGAHEPPPITKR